MILRWYILLWYYYDITDITMILYLYKTYWTKKIWNILMLGIKTYIFKNAWYNRSSENNIEKNAWKIFHHGIRNYILITTFVSNCEVHSPLWGTLFYYSFLEEKTVLERAIYRSISNTFTMIISFYAKNSTENSGH